MTEPEPGYSGFLSTVLRNSAGRSWQAECERLQRENDKLKHELIASRGDVDALIEELRVTRGELDLVTEERDTALLEIDRLLASLS